MWYTKIVDIETAFLEGNLTEEIYMKIPEGYVNVEDAIEEDDCCALEKKIDGLVCKVLVSFGRS